MSRQWAHWHGLELQITSAAQLKFIGVAKKTRTCRVVATIYHSHCRGAPEALLLRIKGVKLLPDYNQPRDGASFAGFHARRTAFEAHADSDHDVVLPIGHPRELAALGFHEPQLANGDLTNERGYVQRTYRRGADSRLVNILVDIGQCFRINQNGADHLFYYCTPTHPEEAARFGFPPAEWCDHELADHIEPVQSGDRGLSLGDSESSDDEVAPAPVAAALAASSSAEPSGEPDGLVAAVEEAIASSAASGAAVDSSEPRAHLGRVGFEPSNRAGSASRSVPARNLGSVFAAASGARQPRQAERQSASAVPASAPAPVRIRIPAQAAVPVSSEPPESVPAAEVEPVVARSSPVLAGSPELSRERVQAAVMQYWEDNAPPYVPPARAPEPAPEPNVVPARAPVHDEGAVPNAAPAAQSVHDMIVASGCSLAAELLERLPQHRATDLRFLDDVLDMLTGGDVPRDARVPANSWLARVSFLDEQLERMRVTFDRDSLGGSHFPQLRASANNEQAVFAACRSICRALRQAKDEAMSRSGSAPNAPAPAPAPEQAPHAPAPAPGLASSWGNYASNHAHYSACMQQGCVGAAIASKGISEEERAALQAESAAAQGAAASLDREGRLGGGPLSAAATALDRAAQSLTVPGGASEDAVRTVGQVMAGLPSELIRLHEAPIGSYTQTSSEILNRSITCVSAATDLWVNQVVQLLIKWIAVDNPLDISEERRQQLRAAIKAVLRGELTSPALWESALLKKGGNSMWASLAAGNSFVTLELLEVLDKVALLCTVVPSGQRSLFAKLRDHIRELLGQHKVDPVTVARYIEARVKAFPFKKFKSGALLLRPTLLESFLDSGESVQAFANARQVGSVLRTVGEVYGFPPVSPAPPAPVQSAPAQLYAPVSVNPCQQCGNLQPIQSAQQPVAPNPPGSSKRAQRKKRASEAAAEAQTANKMPACPHAAAVPPTMWYPPCGCANGVWAQQAAPQGVAPQQAAPFLPQQCQPVAPQPLQRQAAAGAEAIPPQFQLIVPDGRVLDSRVMAIAVNPSPPAKPVRKKATHAELAEWSQANQGRCWSFFQRGFCVRPIGSLCAFAHV